MAKTLQLRRYTTSNLASITGASGELIVDTTLNAITVHTGSQPGGLYTANAITLQAAFTQANTAANTVPQNRQTTNYVLQLSDAGKHLYYETGSNVTIYIPTTANVAFANGNKIMVVSRTSSSANITLAPNTGVSLFAAGNTISGNHNVTTYGVATLMQVAANTWFIQGTGVV